VQFFASLEDKEDQHRSANKSTWSKAAEDSKIRKDSKAMENGHHDKEVTT
jgi:hypothetical protein